MSSTVVFFFLYSRKLSTGHAFQTLPTNYETYYGGGVLTRTSRTRSVLRKQRRAADVLPATPWRARSDLSRSLTRGLAAESALGSPSTWPLISSFSLSLDHYSILYAMALYSAPLSTSTQHCGNRRFSLLRSHRSSGRANLVIAMCVDK